VTTPQTTIRLECTDVDAAHELLPALYRAGFADVQQDGAELVFAADLDAVDGVVDYATRNGAASYEVEIRGGVS
jgi:hypothetical protein